MPIFADKRASTVRIKGNEAAKAKSKVEEILYRHRQTVTSELDPQHVKATRGVNAYLRLIGSERDVRYPRHWAKADGDAGTCRVEEPSTSPLYRQIVRLVNDTWDSAKVGIGFDGTGLTHSKIVVRHIYALKNAALFRQYDTTRRNMCMDASVNRYTPVNGMRGEQEITTRTHITGNPTQHNPDIRILVLHHVNVNVIYLLSTIIKSIIKQHAQLMSWTARQHCCSYNCPLLYIFNQLT